MMPRFPQNNSFNGRAGNFENFGYFTLGKFPRNIHEPNVSDISLGKFCVKSILASLHLALQKCVFHVFAMSSEFQMCWVYTPWVVSARAIMENFKSFGDRKIMMDFPGNSICFMRAFIIPCAKLPISIGFRSKPVPTPVSFLDIFPKTFCNRFLSVVVIAFSTTSWCWNCVRNWATTIATLLCRVSPHMLSLRYSGGFYNGSFWRW